VTGAVPARLVFDGDGPQVEWLAHDGARFAEPFFEDTLLRLRRRPENARERLVRTPASALREVPAGLAPAAFIFHVSRCGSTLAAQMLASLPRNLVASEPPIIDEILRLNQRDSTATDDERIALLRGVVRALAQPPAARVERFFVKLDCWHILSLDVFRRAFPGVPLLFVYRPPIDVLVSLMRRPGFVLVRDTVTPAQLGLTPAERDALTAAEHAAAILGAFFRAACALRSALIPLAYEALPAGLAQALPQCAFTDGERKLLVDVAAFDAKNPAERFRPDTAQKQREATPALIAAAARWADPAYARWLATL